MRGFALVQNSWLMENNRRWLCKLVKELGLQKFESSFEKILIILDEQGYTIEVSDFGGGVFQTCQHYRSNPCSNSEKRIIINQRIEKCLNGCSLNFIWGLLHEIGHMLTVGVRNGDDEMREVIAWDMAQHLLRCDFNELESEIKSFEERVIFSLRSYQESCGNWDNTYEWVSESGERYLKRIANNQNNN